MKTSTFLIGGAALAGIGYLVYKAQQPQPPTAVQSIVDGAKSIVASIFGSKKSTSSDAAPALQHEDVGASSATMIARSLPGYNAGGAGGYATTAFSSYGDAAQTDGAGFSRISGRTQQPYTYYTRAQSAQFGNINYGVNHFALKT